MGCADTRCWRLGLNDMGRQQVPAVARAAAYCQERLGRWHAGRPLRRFPPTALELTALQVRTHQHTCKHVYDAP
jgi:hypothetical protein